MVVARASYVGGEFKSLTITGHAGYGEKGKDLVCAAVSAIAQGGLNALESPDSFEIRVEPGDYSVESKEKVSPHDQTVIETMIAQIESVAVSYPRYARLERK